MRSPNQINPISHISDSRIRACAELDALQRIEKSYNLPEGYWRNRLVRQVNRARRACEDAGVPVDYRIKLNLAIVGEMDGVQEAIDFLTVRWVVMFDDEEMFEANSEDEAEEFADGRSGTWEINIVKRRIN